MGVEAGYHAFHRAFEQCFVGFVFVVVGFDLAVHFGQGADGLHGQRVFLFRRDALQADSEECAADDAQCVKRGFLQDGFCHIVFFSFSVRAGRGKVRTLLDLPPLFNCFYKKIRIPLCCGTVRTV